MNALHFAVVTQLPPIGGLGSIGIPQGTVPEAHARTLREILQTESRPIAKTVVSEDGNIVFTTLARRTEPAGWYRYDLRSQAKPTMDHYKSIANDIDGLCEFWTISQGQTLYDLGSQKPLKGFDQGRWRKVGTEIGSLLGALDATHPIAYLVPEGVNGYQPNGVGVGVIDSSKRGYMPNESAFVKGVRTNGRNVFVRLLGTKLSVVDIYKGTSSSFLFDIRKIMFSKQSSRRLPGDFRSAMTADPEGQLCLLYRSSRNSKPYGWKEYNLRTGKQKSVATLANQMQEAFYSRRELYCNVRKADGSRGLYKASGDRKRWSYIGPYHVIGRSASDKYWFIHRTDTNKVLMVKRES